MDSINKWTNDDLARQLFRAAGRTETGAPDKQSTREALKRANTRREAIQDVRPFDFGPRPPQKPPRTAGSEPMSARPLSKQETARIFQALETGTRARWEREPTIKELLDLVSAIDQARQMLQFADEALAGRAEVYRDGDEWKFVAADAGNGETTVA